MKIWIPALVGLFVLDRFSKAWAAKILAQWDGMTVWPGVIRFQYAENTGVAFSMGSGGGWIVIGVTALMIALVLYLCIKEKSLSRFARCALLTVAVGGTGNLIDRIFYGYVVDFIKPEFINFAIFNVADIMICLGAGLAVLDMLRSGKNKAKHTSQNG